MKLTIFTTASLAIAVFGAVLAKGTDQPDFAFPDKVASEAETRITNALSDNDSQALIKGLIDFSLARNSISPDYLPLVIDKVDSIAAGASAETKDLLSLLQAEMYVAIYSADQWEYDNREVPLEPRPADCRQWSGEQFRIRITELLEQATADPELLFKSPLTDWADIITSTVDSRKLYPTLFDFIAYRAIKVYNQIERGDNIVPARCMTYASYLKTLPEQARISKAKRAIHELYRRLVTLHSDNPGPRILAEVNAATSLAEYNTAAYSLLLEIYNANPSTPWRGLALENIGTDNVDAYPIVKQFVDDCPEYLNINLLRNHLSQMTMPSARANAPGQIAPDHTTDINLVLKNTREFTLRFKHMDSGKTFSFPLTIDRPIPYVCDTTLAVSLPLIGNYAIETVLDGKVDPISYQTTHVSRIGAMTTSFNSRGLVFAVDPITGAPLKGIAVESRAGDNKIFHSDGLTDSDGAVNFRATPGNNNYLRLISGSDSTFLSIYISNYRKDTDSIVTGRLFTDLSLYHPGDTLRWALVAFNAAPAEYSQSPSSGLDVEVTIEDVNGKTIFADTVTTDATGRARGLCRLPLDGLSGEYTITAESIEDSDNIAYTSVIVNDYKLPTFEVITTDTRRSTLPDSAVTITFRAVSYSGFPIADATVNFELSSGSSRYPFYSNTPSDNFWTTTSSTDRMGYVSLTIPSSILDLSPVDTKNFCLNAIITSPAGETQSESTRFSIGKPYNLILPLPARINLDDDTPIEAIVSDANGKRLAIDLKAVLIAPDSTTTPVTLGKPLPAKLTPGLYTLKVAPADTTLADAVRETTYLYASKGKCPFAELTIPQPVITSKDGKASITYGVPFDNANLLVFEIVDSTFTSYHWIKKNAGMHSLDLDIPSSTLRTKITIFTFHDNRSFSASATITNPDYNPTLTIETETFRDKVVPGDKETITLLFKDRNSNPVPAYALLGMSSSALNKLNQHSWNLQRYAWRFPDLRTETSYYLNYFYSSKSFKSLPTVNISQPVFDLHGLSFSPYDYRQRMYKSRAASSPDYAIVGNEHILMTTLSRPVEAIKSESVFDDEVVVTGYGAQESDDSDESSSSATLTGDDFKYRPSEIPLAFFEPMLSSDADGRLTYTYTVPDANTSWQFDVAAYTPEIVVGKLMRTVVASRPVMVQTNPTRFLRYGDRATLKASVMNMADSAIVAVTTLSIVDANTLATLATEVSTNTIKANASVTVSIPFRVTTDMPQAVIYRVKTSAGRHTDGEQTLIPILPASQPVVVSSPFFIPADEDSAEIAIEAVPGDARTTLYLYDNPLWEVVTALPSISDGAPTTSVAVANQLYKSSIANGLMKAYPAVRNGLKEWFESDRSDSSLVSQLQRNDDLKQISLNATPWVRQAMSQSERLTSLALIFDDDYIKASTNQAIEALEGLMQPDGGFAWAPGSEQSSEWATYRVLNLFALLKTNDYLPASKKLDNLIDRALEYVDNQAAEQYKKWGNKYNFTDYVALRSLLPSAGQSSLYKKIAQMTVNSILKRWQTEPIVDRATDAIILSRNGYPTMAHRLIASIVASSMSSHEKGMWWSRLDSELTSFVLKSVEMVDPDNQKTIDAVAQWLILAKTAQDWGDSFATASVVNALLTAIPADQAATATTDVTLNDNTIVSDTPQLPGMTVSDISGLLGGKDNTLAINKPTGLPAMGSVITRSISEFDSIAQRSNPSISIAKRINVVRGTGVVEADTLKVGDRIRVQLIFTVTDALDYVTVIDRNAACLEPVKQLSGYRYQDGMWFYRETTDIENRMFITHLPVGTYIVDYEMYVMAEGAFSSGVATLQSQINPAIDANSSARRITVVP